MAEDGKRRVATGGATFGALLVLVGVGILLERSQVIPEGALWRLWDLWPLLLVGWGLAVLAVSTNQAWLAWLGPVLVLGVGGWLLATASEDTPAVEPGTLTEAVEGSGDVAVEISFGAGDLSLGSGGGEALVVDHEGTPRPRLRVDRETVELSADRDSWSCLRNRPGAVWTVKLPARTTAVSVDAGAADIEGDLTDLAITEVDVDVGAADVDLKLGRRARTCTVTVDAGASDVTIRVPKDARVEVKADIAAGDSTVDEGEPSADGPEFVIDVNGGAMDFELARYQAP